MNQDICAHTCLPCDEHCHRHHPFWCPLAAPLAAPLALEAAVEKRRAAAIVERTALHAEFMVNGVSLGIVTLVRADGCIYLERDHTHIRFQAEDVKALLMPEIIQDESKQFWADVAEAKSQAGRAA